MAIASTCPVLGFLLLFATVYLRQRISGLDWRSPACPVDRHIEMRRTSYELRRSDYSFKVSFVLRTVKSEGNWSPERIKSHFNNWKISAIESGVYSRRGDVQLKWNEKQSCESNNFTANYCVNDTSAQAVIRGGYQEEVMTGFDCRERTLNVDKMSYFCSNVSVSDMLRLESYVTLQCKTNGLLWFLCCRCFLSEGLHFCDNNW